MRLLLLLVCLPLLGTAQIDLQESILPVYQSEVYFPSGSAVPYPGTDTLWLDLSSFRELPQLAVRLTAHTDDVGSAAANDALAAARGRTITDSLLSYGFDSTQIDLISYGERAPATANTTEAQRRQNRRVTIDIVQRFQTRAVEGRIVDGETGAGIVAEVFLRSKSFQDSTFSDSTGHYRLRGPVGGVVAIDAYAPGHFFSTKMLKLPVGKMVPLEIPLAPLAAGTSVDLPAFYFVGGQPVLLPRSKPILSKLLVVMQRNPDLRIEIAGHVNVPNQPPVLRSSREYKLSVARARRVYDYLTEHRIDPDRIQYKGYGNWEMVNPYAKNEKAMAANRRVEIRILE